MQMVGHHGSCGNGVSFFRRDPRTPSFNRSQGFLVSKTIAVLNNQYEGASIGPAVSSSYQKLLEEAPPDWRINAIGTVQGNLRRYAKELSNIDSVLAEERRDELEAFLRDRAKAKTGDIPDGELEAVMDAYLRTQFYKGKPRAIPGPKQKVCDAVRKSCEYTLKKLLKEGNQMTKEIARHLDEFVVIGQTCEYKGEGWKWRF